RRLGVAQTHRSGERGVGREANVSGGGLGLVTLEPEERGAKRGERDFELIVVRLDRGDLLHEETGPQKNAERALGAVPREDALDLERDRRDQRQERELHEEEDDTVEDFASGVDPRKESADRRE